MVNPGRVLLVTEAMSGQVLMYLSPQQQMGISAVITLHRERGLTFTSEAHLEVAADIWVVFAGRCTRAQCRFLSRAEVCVHACTVDVQS